MMGIAQPALEDEGAERETRNGVSCMCVHNVQNRYHQLMPLTPT